MRINHLYFIRGVAGGPVRIGRTIAPRRQIESLFAGQSPVPLRLLAFVPGGKVAEGYVCKLFADLRLRGPWFDVNDSLLEFIATAAQLNRIPDCPDEVDCPEWPAQTENRLAAVMSRYDIEYRDAADFLGISRQALVGYAGGWNFPHKHVGALVLFFRRRGIELRTADFLKRSPRKRAA